MYDMLEEAETKGHAHVVSWCKEGRSFKVHRPDEMINILNTYFSQTKYKSFLRQLQTYGFTRVTRGEFKGIVSHPLLIQGKRFLCLRMKRKVRKQKSNSISPSSHSTSRLSLLSQVSEKAMYLATDGKSSLDTQQRLGRLASTRTMPMAPSEDRDFQNVSWPMLGIASKLGQDFSSNSLSLGDLTRYMIPNLAASSYFTGYRTMPLLPTKNSVVAQERVLPSAISNILDEIDDCLCDHYTKTTNPFKLSDDDILRSILHENGEVEDDDWLKDIVYEGSDIVFEPENSLMTF
jgi:hypothetical protein